MTGKTNETSVGSLGEEERVCWIVFHVIIALLSLTGDSVILIGTTRYKAIKLHRVLVVTIQHLAVSDLLLTVFRVTPRIVSLVAERNVLSTFLCLFNLNMTFICTSTTAVFTCVLATFKLLIVQRPLRTEIWSRKRAHVICGLVWLVCVLQPYQVTHLFLSTGKSLYFDKIYYFCNVDRFATLTPVWFVWFQIIFTYFAFLAMIVILLTTSLLLLHAAKQSADRHAGSLQWRGILTVTLTTAVFLVSYLPNLVVSFTGRLIHLNSSLKRGALFFENINIVANFFVYSLTVRSFREFLSARTRHLALQLGLTSPTTPRTLRQLQLTQQRSQRILFRETTL